jgi:catechol 2,3-dioxygenase-like lactoylglutathione lyase family enzyme
MDTPTTVKRISPMIPVADLKATVAFFRDVLGFEPVLQVETYAVVERDGQSVHFMPAADDETLKAVRQHMEFYVEVRGIRRLWAHVEQFKGRYQIRDLFERDYGMTEFHIKDPDGCLVFVGEPTALVDANPTET